MFCVFHAETNDVAELADLEPIDSDNTARFPEGQLVPTFNNGARALEGILARWLADTNGTIVSTGSAPSYAIATASSYVSLVDGLVVVWRAHASFTTGTAKLTVNALAQKNLVRQDGTALKVGDIVEDQTVVSRYNSDMDAFECLGIAAKPSDTDFSSFFPGALLAILEDRKSANTDPQTGPGSSWAARHLNTEVYDRLGIVSIASNQFTFSEDGAFEIGWESPLWGSSGKTRLYDITNSTEVALGTQGRWPGGTGNTMYYSTGLARVSVTAGQTFEVQMYGSADGGQRANLDGKQEIYTRVIIRRG